MGDGVRRIAPPLLLALLLTACGGDRPAGERSLEERCGLPPPRGKVDLSKVPPELLIEEGEVRKVTDRKDLLVVALNVPLPVTEVYDDYLGRLQPPEYHLITEDNEIFEAELYYRRGEDDTLVAIQARRPKCNDASSVFVTLSSREQ